jgi:PAB1-binding protein PBP1
VAVEEEGRPAVPTKTMTGVAVLVNGKSVLVLFGHSTNAFSITNHHIHSNSSLCSGATT